MLALIGLSGPHLDACSQMKNQYLGAVHAEIDREWAKHDKWKLPPKNVYQMMRGAVAGLAAAGCKSDAEDVRRQSLECSYVALTVHPCPAGTLRAVAAMEADFMAAAPYGWSRAGRGLLPSWDRLSRLRAPSGAPRARDRPGSWRRGPRTCTRKRRTTPWTARRAAFSSPPLRLGGGSAIFFRLMLVRAAGGHCRLASRRRRDVAQRGEKGATPNSDSAAAS